MKKTKERIAFLLLASFFLCVFLFPDSVLAQAAVTNESSNWFVNGFHTVVKSILYAFIWISSLMASTGMTLLNWAMTPSFFSGPNGVMNRVSIYESWRFIRDFFNIFFIFALLFSAFATIFQVEQYSIKKMLLSLVLWALLVNFSFPIARFMVDLSNVPMYYFANQLFDQGSTGNMGSILSATKLENLIMTGKADTGYEIEKMKYERIFAAIIFLFLLGVTMLVLGVMFVIRTVALITLVIFSAVGFSGLAIPWFKKYAGMWWDNMFKYLIYGPAATLLILIAVRFFAEIGRDSDMTFRNLQTAAGTASTGGMQVMIGSMAMYTIPIAMLWMSIGLAGSFSIFGAAAISGRAEKFAKYVGGIPGRTAWKGAKFVGRKTDSALASNRVGKYFSLGAWRTALKQRSEEQKEKDELPIKLAGSTMQDQLNAGMSRVKNTILPTSWRPGKFMRNTDHTDHRFAERERQKAKYAKEITEVTDRSEHVIAELKAAVKGKNAAKAEAALAILAKNNDLNDLLMDAGDEFGGTNEVSSKNAKTVLANIFKQAGVAAEEDIAKSLMVLSDQAMASGNYAFGGLSSYDSDTHTFSVSGVSEDGKDQQAEQVSSKFNNLEPQKQATMLHPDTLFKRSKGAISDANKGGFTDMNDEVASAIASRVTVATGNQMNRSRSDMRAGVQNAWEQVTQHGRGEEFPVFRENYNTKPAFRYFVGKVLEQNGALPAGVENANGMPNAI